MRELPRETGRTMLGVVTLSDWIQIAVVVSAVGASIVALLVASQDRRAAIRAAADERRYQALRFELEHALRLAQNTDRGGSTDEFERRQLGAEQMMLVGLLGKERVPLLWERRFGVTDQHLQELLRDTSQPDFKKWQYESQLAVNAIIREIDAFHDK